MIKVREGPPDRRKDNIKIFVTEYLNLSIFSVSDFHMYQDSGVIKFTFTYL